jgi:hypothetical protein
MWRVSFVCSAVVSDVHMKHDDTEDGEGRREKSSLNFWGLAFF